MGNKMPKVLVCSVHFGAGHTAHLNAYQKMLAECGYDAALYIDPRYMNLLNDVKGKIFFDLQDGLNFHPDVVWIWNTGFENIKIIRAFKKINSRIAYVLHEPFMGVGNLTKEKGYLIKGTGAMLLNYWLCMKSDKVIVCSQEGEKNCRMYMKGAYKKHILFPLAYPDEMVEGLERKYFSKIGGFGITHGSEQFLNFVKQSYVKNNIFFQIATRANITEKLKDSSLQSMIKEGRLIVQQGRPLTEKEMNEAYRRSICTWNGYLRSTQSGVLANSFMQGTPVIATHLGSFDEYVKDGENGTFIDDYSYDTIFNAYQRIASNIDEMSKNARNTFLEQFYYRNQEEKFKEIIESLVN